MIRTITITSAILLMTSPPAHAGEYEIPFLNLDHETDSLERPSLDMSPHEYEQLYSHNQKQVLKNLRTYSKNALQMIGVPERGITLVGASLGLLFHDPSINLNRSKTLALEMKNAEDSDRSLHFRVKLVW
jgi:hypothetical protein